MLTQAALLTGVGLGLVALAGADFTLTAPAAIENKGDGTVPCGEYDALDREIETDWPVLGHDVGVNTDDAGSVFTFRAALVDDLTNFVALRPAVHHKRPGDFCFMRISGVAGWVGQKAVVEVRQYIGGGAYTFRCAAVTFVKGGPAPPACRGFHEQLVENHTRRLAEMAQAEQRDLGSHHRREDAVTAAGDDDDNGNGNGNDDDDDDDDDEEDSDEDSDDDNDDDLGHKPPTPSTGTVAFSTYTHMHATPVPSGSVGEASSYSSPPYWAHNQTLPTPMPTGGVDTPGAGPADASPIAPVPESEAAGFSRGFVLLNLGLVASLVTLFSL